MSRIDGPSRHAISQRADRYSTRVVRAIHDTLRVVTDAFSGVVTLDDLSVIMREWKRRVDAPGGLLDDVRGAYEAGARSTRSAQRDAFARALVAAAGDSFSVPLVANDRAESLLQAARNRLVNVSNEVWELARGELLTGLQAGEGVPELRDRVMGATRLAAPRAQTIARSEIAHAMNSGSLDQMRQLAAPGMTKEWIATGDGRTRPEHAAMNGQRVALNQPFSIGEEPGDAVNCRCTYGFELPDSELIDAATVDETFDLPRLGQADGPSDWGIIKDSITGSDRKELVDVLNVQAAIVPRAARALTSVSGETTMRSTSLGAYDSAFHKLQLNARLLLGQDGSTRLKRQNDEAIARGERGFKSHSGPGLTDLQVTFSHEFGHHVARIISAAGREKVFAALANELGVTPPGVKRGQWVAAHRDRLESVVSVYGSEDQHELLAEIWSEYSTNPNARPIIKAVGDVMRRLAE